MDSILDESIGILLDYLHQNKNIWENTIIIFASDNGGAHSFQNYPLRGAKGTFFEGGIRVPSFLTGRYLPILQDTRHQNEILRTSKFFFMSDWFATILSFCGVQCSSYQTKHFLAKTHTSS